MTESLLGFSKCQIFGEKVYDLQIVSPALADATDVKYATSSHNNLTLRGPESPDGVPVATGDTVLVKNQTKKKQNGVYTADATAGAAWTLNDTANNTLIKITDGVENKGKYWVVTRKPSTGGATGKIRYTFDSYDRKTRGQNKQLFDQFEDACFAKIFGFSYEGRYYDLARPTLFMVHGDGEPATLPGELSPGVANPHLARAPLQSSAIGMAAADFQFTDELRVWSYDKADYTIRMDVETGMFEQVLLDAELASGEMPTSVSGAHARVSGAHARVSGAHARVSGAHARLKGNRGD
jgi:hypothetical protein